jgi:hypothetical protein
VGELEIRTRAAQLGPQTLDAAPVLRWNQECKLYAECPRRRLPSSLSARHSRWALAEPGRGKMMCRAIFWWILNRSIAASAGRRSAFRLVSSAAQSSASARRVARHGRAISFELRCVGGSPIADCRRSDFGGAAGMSDSEVRDASASVKFRVVCRDHFGTEYLLGQAKIPLSNLPDNRSEDVTLKLKKTRGKSHPSLRLKVRWSPVEDEEEYRSCRRLQHTGRD